MAIGPAEVVRLARLARLELEAAEAEQLGEELSQILAHVARLGADDGESPGSPDSGEPPSAVRPDEARPGERRSELLASGPVTEDSLFVVPRVIRSP